MNGALAPTDPRYASVMETQKIPPGRLRTFNQVVGAVRIKRVKTCVERFDRRGIEPFELFTSEFGQNSVKIEYILLENAKKI